MSRYYILKINNADLTDLWNSRPISARIFNGINFRAKIKFNGISQRTHIVDDSVVPTWNESFPLHVVQLDDSSLLTVDITVINTVGMVTHIGYGQIDLCIGDFQVSLSSTKGKGPNSSSSISVNVQSSNPIECTRLTLENIIRDIVGSNDIMEDIDKIIQEGKNILKSDLAKSLKSLEIADAIVNGIDHLSEVHPVLNLGWSVFSSLYKLVSQQMKLDKKIHEFLEDIVNLFRVLVDTSNIKHKADSLTQAIEELLDFIIECSLFIQGYIRRGFIERTLRPSEKSVIEEYEKRIRILKSRLEMGITITNSSLLVENTNSIERITQQTLLLNLESKLHPVHLSGIDRPECLKGTRMDIRNEIHDWATLVQHPNVLLLLGAAGTGKSTIATTISREYRKKKQLGSYSFFIRSKSGPESVLTTIACDLAEYSNELATYIEAALSGRGSLHSTALEEQFDLLINEPLHSAVLSGFTDPVLIVLDALDECGTPQARRSLIRLLRTSLPSLPPNFRFFITARPEEDIISLRSLPSIYNILLDQQSEDSKKDVLAYITHEFDELRDSNRLKIPVDWPWEQSMKILAFNAGGLFIWASTAVKFVSERKAKRFVILDRLVRDAKMLDLNELYVTVLENSVDWDEEGRYNFANILSLIFFGRAPLTDNEIDSILGLEQDTTEELLSGLRSLIMYEPGQPIKIHHASFYDYLVSCKGEKWYIDIEEQKIMIASRCFDRMKEELHFNMCHLESSFVRNEDVPDLGGRVKKYIPTFLQYVCCNWMYHLQDVGYSEVLHDQLKVFTKDKLLFWFEVLSLTGAFELHVGTMLVHAISWLANKDPELSAFLRDAYRQACIFSDPISQSMPHIYCTFLPFTKEESVISKHYAAYANSANQVEYVGDKRRSACMKVIHGQRGSILSVKFSPDGSCVASGSKGGGGICMWNAVGGEIISKQLDESSIAVKCITFSPDGKYIASGLEDGTTTISCALNGDLLQGFICKQGASSRAEGIIVWVSSVAFSPRGNLLASGISDSTIQLWELEGITMDENLLKGHTEEVTSVSFSPDGLYLASGSTDRSVIVWMVQSREMAFSPLRGHKDSVLSVAFSPNGEDIVSGSRDGTVRIWQVSSRCEIRRYEVDDFVNSVAYSPDGLNILVGADDVDITMWNMSNSEEPPKYFEGSRRCSSLAFSPDGIRFLSGHWDGTIKIWDVAGGVTSKSESQVESKFSSVSVSASGCYIASADGGRKEVCVVDSLSGKLAFGPFKEGFRGQITFSPIDDMILACIDCEDVIVRNLANGNTAILRCHTGHVRSIAFSPNGKHIASGFYDETICTWDFESGKLIIGPLKVRSVINSIAYSPDGKKIVTGAYDAKIRIWDTKTGRLFSTLQGHSGEIHSVAYSRDSRLIASGASDHTIRVWNAENKEPIFEMRHKNEVLSVCFLPDGKQILSSSKDNNICIWDASTGNLLNGPLEGHSRHVTSVSSFPSGKYFASGSYDGTVRIWTLDSIYQQQGGRDGWLTDRDSNLLIWLPPNLRQTVSTSRSRLISRAPLITKLDFTRIKKGDEWTKIPPPLW